MLMTGVEATELLPRRKEPITMLTLANSPAEPGEATPPDSALTPSMTAAEICRALGGVDLGVARRHHVEVATVVAELAEDARMNWPWTHDDPTVALLRALARISIVAPGSTSPKAESLFQSIEIETVCAATAGAEQRVMS